ncbi:hydroxymethylbilane synthase [Salisediminibacterium halotolerans]|uniref:Porphobilinogen deaminase n=1 Tax=Salisediminibacterium halotolerans TaxID=517425 RepID=A0A1H9U469_9BACI|nr:MULTISPECIES: hydroxymethylbilane synthase [Salisediminibacterium]RLJ81099.1 hydroxymethylbilane synthase [Actinophytocola xinjiangensis]RPE84092.1 hydroxymethylbilane synthase [Salisediminibacterium halotolerans]TWG38526.1 hydroxymethylbilane synthase [Salisediminibacterium halotolerans]SES03873.1 hydroxymethylbilane synthase [Salisediminibacterium haloalkalitolerans]GEL07198.1 porphobilinogen deaminase [Salisediminibacterium halotolerans]
MRKVIIGSRRSNLAMTQTREIIERLKELNLPYEFEIKEIVTKGDQILDRTLSKVGGKGLFVKEIEQAMYNGEIDLAVHSMKDIPSGMAEGLVMGAVPKRIDPRDAFISNSGEGLMELPAGAVVGTSSLRRKAQVLAKRPDLEIKWIRGNIDTRIRKCREEDYDAIVLAAAGLERVGWSDEIVTEFLAPKLCLPAVGQGALGIECREDDEDIINLLNHIHDPETARTVTAERAFLHTVEGGCEVPIAGHAVLHDDQQVTLTALVSSPDGKQVFKEVITGDDPHLIGVQAAEKMLEEGAKKVLDDVKDELDRS